MILYDLPHEDHYRGEVYAWRPIKLGESSNAAVGEILPGESHFSAAVRVWREQQGAELLDWVYDGAILLSSGDYRHVFSPSKS